jgi:FMN-dependent NADH-azoreductase
MSHLLTVSVSPRQERSWSRTLLEEFVGAYRLQHPGVEVVNRETYEIPHISWEAILAGRTPIADQTPGQREIFRLQDSLTEEVFNAEHLVIATPMYNWGLPSALKAWVDHLVNVRTYYFGAVGSFIHVPITVIIASGALFSEGPQVASDNLRPHLRTIFHRLGAQEPYFINADPTGPLERGEIEREDPAGAFQRALSQIHARVIAS